MEISLGSLLAAGIPSNPNEQFFDIPTFARYNPRPAFGNGVTLNH